MANPRIRLRGNALALKSSGPRPYVALPARRRIRQISCSEAFMFPLRTKLEKLAYSATAHWVGEVPVEDACCEFECREEHCGLERWTTCENRLAYVALMRRCSVADEHASSQRY
jgi:hypothetical protein